MGLMADLFILRPSVRMLFNRHTGVATTCAILFYSSSAFFPPIRPLLHQLFLAAAKREIAG